MQLYSKEIEEYLGKRRDSTARAYNIYSEEGNSLAHLFTSRESYTFAWFGSIEFNDLGSFIEEEFLLRFSDEWYFYDYFYPPITRTSLVSLIVHETEITSLTEQQEKIELLPSNPELVRFEVVNGKWPESYRKYLLEPSRISFARVDYEFAVRGWQATPSFTAENPNSRPLGKSEIAIKTHHTYRYSYSLLEFIYFSGFDLLLQFRKVGIIARLHCVI